MADCVNYFFLLWSFSGGLIKIRFQFVHLILLAFLLQSMAIDAKSADSVSYSRTRLLMGQIPVTVTVQASPAAREQVFAAMEAAYELAGVWEARWSEFQADSEISCLNQQAGKSSCVVSPETFALLQRAMQWSRLTGGDFDIRFASRSNAGRQGSLRFDEKKSQVALRQKNTRIGLGGIAKGTIVDLMGNRLRELGFKKFLINAGGDLLAAGGPWPVALALPQNHGEGITDSITLTDRAMATSGNAERGAHIRNPHTGKSVVLGGSVTVWAQNLETADVWATAAWVKGSNYCPSGEKNTTPAVKVLWLTADGKERHCPSPLGTVQEVSP